MCTTLILLGIQGFILHKQLRACVFSSRFIPSKLQISITYILGYGIPTIFVTVCLLVSFLNGVNHYVRFEVDSDGNRAAVDCWLDVDSELWAFIFPVALMILINLCVVIRVINIAYHATSQPR